MYTELSPSGSCLRLKDLRIVRLNNGHYSQGAKCFFAAEELERDDILPRVDSAVYTSGKSKPQQENAKKFLTEIGVREVGEAELVEAILKQRHTEEAEVPNDRTYRKDLKRFVSLVDEQPDTARLFASYWSVRTASGASQVRSSSTSPSLIPAWLPTMQSLARRQLASGWQRRTRIAA